MLTSVGLNDDQVWHDPFHPENYSEYRHKNLCVPKKNVLYLKDENICRPDVKEHLLKKILDFMEFHGLICRLKKVA